MQQWRYSERLLLEMRAGTEGRDNAGCTALHLAATKGHKDVTRLLLKYGADIRSKDAANCTALRIALLNRQMAVARLLVERADPGATHWLQKRGYNIASKSVLEDIVSPRKGPALARAAWEGNEAAVCLLLEVGVGAEITCCGYTPLHLAAMRGHAGVTQLLLDNGANVKARDEVYGHSKTALNLAATNGHLEVLKTMFEWDTDDKTKAWLVGTARDWVFGYPFWNQRVMRLLVEKEVDFRARTYEGERRHCFGSLVIGFWK